MLLNLKYKCARIVLWLLDCFLEQPFDFLAERGLFSKKMYGFLHHNIVSISSVVSNYSFKVYLEIDNRKGS